MDRVLLTIGVADSVADIEKSLEEISNLSDSRSIELDVYYTWANSRNTHFVGLFDLETVVGTAAEIYAAGEAWLVDHLLG